MSSTYWAPLTAFSTTLVTTWWLIRSQIALNVLDRPNERSLHQLPIPRAGGIGIHAGIFLAWLILAPEIGSLTWICLLVLISLSCLDDVRGVSVLPRLAVHLATAMAVSYQILWNLPAWWLAPIAALAICWMANLYNFMDGSDGLAGGMTLFGFATYGIATWIAGDTTFACLNLSISATAAAFLIFNFHPAKIFMGDAGSVPLGYLAGVFGLIGWMNGYWTLWFPVLVFSPFIVDASMTLAHRLFRGERVWHAHRDHYYQRLVQLDWGHRKTALAEYVLMATCAIAGLVTLRFPPVTLTVITLFLGVYIALMIAITCAWARTRSTRS